MSAGPEPEIARETATKEELLAAEQAWFLALPQQEFEARRVKPAKANSLSLVRFECNDYSVPTEYAHHDVMVIGGIEEVRLVVGDRLVARHPRHWGKEHIEFNPVHYLALLERKPGALDYAKPLENWKLPDCLIVLRRRQKTNGEAMALASSSRCCGCWNMPACRNSLVPWNTGLVDRSQQCRRGEVDPPVAARAAIASFCLDGRPHLQGVHVPPPNLEAYAPCAWRLTMKKLETKSLVLLSIT